MMSAPASHAAVGPFPTDDRVFARLKFELALGLAARRGRPWAEIVRQAVHAAGGQLSLVLPLPGPEGDMGDQAVLRIHDGALSRVFHVWTEDGGFVLAEGEEIDPALLALARSSAELLDGLRADREFLAALASPAD